MPAVRLLLLSCLLLFVALAGWAQAPGLSLSTERPGNLFPAASSPVIQARSTAAAITWQVSDFDGKQVASGETPTQEGLARLTLPALPHGYYELSAKAGADTAKLSFGLVTDHSGQAPASGRLNVDAAGAWLVKGEQFQPMAQVLRTIGIGWVRERFSWGGTEAEAGKVNWQQYDVVAEAYNQSGVRVYQIFHDSPEWTHAGDKDTKNPRDLRDVYRFARRIGEHYRGKVSAWEIWNEPDIAFWPDLSDTYAGVMKAAYLGLKSADPALPVLLGSLCRGLSDFDRGLLDAGVKDYFDIFNWHCYAPPPAYSAILGAYLGLLDEHGCADRPVWLTECGIPLRATLPDGELSSADERLQAEFMPRSLASSLAAGTDRHFFFVFPYYLENGVQFGALHRDLSPRPACVAIATAVDLLGEARYLGQLPLPQAPDATALAFDSGRGRVLVAWSDKPVTVEFAVGADRVTVADLMGQRRTVEAPAGKLSLEVGPRAQYVVGVGESATLTGKVRAPGKLPQTRPSDVVIRGQAQLSDLDKDRDCYRISGNSFTYSVEAYNFGTTKAVEGKLSLTLPAGWSCVPREVAVSLPPMGRAVGRFAVTAGELTVEPLSLVATGRFENITVAPSVSHFRLDFTKVPPRAVQDLKLNDATQWTSNISGNGTMQLSAAEGGGVRTEATFTQPGDRWCYPFVTLEPPLDFSKFQGVAFEYRCGAQGDNVTARLQLYEPGGSAYLPGALKAAKDWTRTVVRFEDLQWGSFSPVDANAKFDPQAVARVMVGLNTPEDKAWLEIRNLQLVKW